MELQNSGISEQIIVAHSHFAMGYSFLERTIINIKPDHGNYRTRCK